MINTNIKRLAQLTAGNKKVDSKIADFVMNKLTRRELIEYARYLKMLVDKRTVKIYSSEPLAPALKNSLENKFGDMNVVFERLDIGDGIYAQVNDTMIDLTISGMLDQTIEELKQV